MHVYIGAYDEEKVCAMTLLDPNMPWDEMKHTMAVKCFPERHDLDEMPVHCIRVYLLPHKLDVEDESGDNMHPIQFLCQHCIVLIQILPESARTSNSDGQEEIVEVAEERVINTPQEQITPSKTRQERFQEHVDTYMIGYMMTTCQEYQKELVMIPNRFESVRKTIHRQYDIITMEDHVECLICPMALRPTPTTELDVLSAHSDTRWHKRYLTAIVTGKSEFQVSLSLFSRFESEKRQLDRSDFPLERLRRLRQSPALTFGHHVYKADVRAQEKKSILVLQGFFRMLSAKKRSKALHQAFRQRQTERFEKMKQNNQFVWHSIIKDLCKDCTTYHSCKKHPFNPS